MAALLIAVLIAGGLYYRSHRTKPLTSHDTLFSPTLLMPQAMPSLTTRRKTALSVSMGQSPFYNILSDSDVAQTLQQMARPTNTKLTPDVAREVCLRAGSAAYIVGSIVSLGNEYVLALKAVNCQTGDVLGQEQVTAASKEKVLDALGQAVSKLRGRLGESLATVQRFDVPLYQATTSSLEALKAYSQGRAADNEKGEAAALRFHLRAMEPDPNFASSYLEAAWIYLSLLQPARASEYFTKAFQLREHASERERLAITANYYANVTGELDEAAQAGQDWIDSYPRDCDAYNSLGLVLGSSGIVEKASGYSQSGGVGPGSWVLIFRSRHLRSRHAATRRGRQSDSASTAAKPGGEPVPQRALCDGLSQRGRSGHEAAAVLVRERFAVCQAGAVSASDTEAYAGKLANARALTNRALGSALRTDSKESGAILLAVAAVRGAACRQ